MKSLALYLATAENLMSQHDGVQPQTSLSQAAQDVLTTLEAVQQAASQANLIPPTGKPLVIIQDVQADMTSAQQLHVDISISNIGVGIANDVSVSVLVHDVPVASPAIVVALAPNEQVQVPLTISLPSTAMFTVQIRSQNAFMDSRLVCVPDKCFTDRIQSYLPFVRR